VDNGLVKMDDSIQGMGAVKTTAKTLQADE